MSAIIVVEGHRAAGKTVFTSMLARALSEVNVPYYVHRGIRPGELELVRWEDFFYLTVSEQAAFATQAPLVTIFDRWLVTDLVVRPASTTTVLEAAQRVLGATPIWLVLLEASEAVTLARLDERPEPVRRIMELGSWSQTALAYQAKAMLLANELRAPWSKLRTDPPVNLKRELARLVKWARENVQRRESLLREGVAR